MAFEVLTHISALLCKPILCMILSKRSSGIWRIFIKMKEYIILPISIRIFAYIFFL